MQFIHSDPLRACLSILAEGDFVINYLLSLQVSFVSVKYKVIFFWGGYVEAICYSKSHVRKFAHRLFKSDVHASVLQVAPDPVVPLF